MWQKIKNKLGIIALIEFLTVIFVSYYRSEYETRDCGRSFGALCPSDTISLILSWTATFLIALNLTTLISFFAKFKPQNLSSKILGILNSSIFIFFILIVLIT